MDPPKQPVLVGLGWFGMDGRMVGPELTPSGWKLQFLLWEQKREDLGKKTRGNHKTPPLKKNQNNKKKATTLKKQKKPLRSEKKLC